MKNLVLTAGLCLLLIILGCEPEEGKVETIKGTSLTIDGKIGLAGLIALTEAHIQDIVRSMEALALSDEIKSGEWGRMKPMLRKFRDEKLYGVVLFGRPDGSYYTLERDLTDRNIRDRYYFQEAISGKVSVGDLILGKTTNKRLMVVAVPVKRDGSVIGVLGVGLHLDYLSNLLAEELEIPDNMMFYAITEDGNTAIHSDTKFLFEQPDEMRSETLSKAINEMLSQEEGEVSYVLSLIHI